MKNYRLLLSYDGSRYRGWQRLGDSSQTIQGKLEQVLSRMSNAPIEVIGSGRTDAGAHAWGQVANFYCPLETTPEKIREYLCQYLPEDIGVRLVEEADSRFHSRYLAKEKTYIYRIWNSEEPCVFSRKYVWQVPGPLDDTAMILAAQQLLGCHDFQAFCSLKPGKKRTIRTLNRLDMERRGPEIIWTASGDGFLYNMVRILVGTMVEVGKGQIAPEEMGRILASKDRQLAGPTAPPQGLILMQVSYS